MLRPRASALAVLTAVCLLAAACSSTERTSSGSADDGAESATDVSDPKKVASSARPDATDTPGAAPGANAAAGVPGAGPASIERRPAGTSSVTRKVPTGTGARGVTDTTILLGAQTADLAAFNAAAAALGSGGNFDQPDSSIEGERKAVTDYINAHGGIAGRKVQWVIHELSTTNAVTKEGRARDAQTACATYTEDNKVFAFLGSSAWTEDNVIQCAIDTKTVYVDHTGQGANLSKRRAAEAANVYYNTSRLVAEERERALVDGLVRRGKLPKGTRVGILMEDEPASREGVANALEPALKAKGAVVAAKAAYPDIISSPWNSYVLQFQQARVSLVIMASSSYGYWPTLNFMRAAQDQGYTPRYGLTSDDSFRSQVRDGNPDQLKNVSGIGWEPMRDVGHPDNTERTRKFGPNEQLCVDISKKAGYPAGSFARPICELLFFLKLALERADEISTAGLRKSVEAMGPAFNSIYTPATRFAPGRHLAAATVRDIGWDAKCGCFQYISGLQTVR